MVVGADGGLGAAYVDACSADVASSSSPSSEFCLTSRRPVSSVKSNIVWRQLDFERAETVANLQEELADELTHIDHLVIATGLLHDSKIQPEKGLSQLTQAKMQRLFTVNTAGPLGLLVACERLLKKARQPKICLLSAQVGSIEDNHLGGWYSYRMSKAALNMGIKTASIEMARWKNRPTIVAVHPGTTHSPLSRPFVARRKAPVQTAASAGMRLKALIDGLTPEQSGQLLTLDGNQLPY